MKYTEYLERELRLARKQILALEIENSTLKADVNKYLGKWCSALDLAAFRQIQALCGVSPSKE